jgi:hypothetical protein
MWSAAYFNLGLHTYVLHCHTAALGGWGARTCWGGGGGWVELFGQFRILTKTQGGTQLQGVA